jgi:hypothetical protein
MKMGHSFVLGALIAAAAGVSAARADFDFTFSSSPTITAASANPPGTVDTITNGITIGGLPAATFTSVAASGTSTISLQGRNTMGPFDATFGTNTPFLDVTVTSNDSALRTYSLNFDVAYVLTDPTPSGGPGPQTVHFTGKLEGQINNSASSMSFTVANFSPALGAGPTVTAGDGTFHVTLDSFNDVGLGPADSGGLTAHVEAVPEPASLAILALGGVALLARRVRR